MPDPGSFKITVGIVAFNSEGNLPELVDSLDAGLAGVANWQLYVVDSGSTDATIEVAERLAPQAKIIRFSENRGFAAGINAVAAADPLSDAILALSPTARLRDGCVRRMLAALDDPATGIVVPRLFGGDGELRASLRRTPTLLRAAAESLLGGSLVRRFGTLSEMVANPAGYTAATPAEWATGGVTLISRRCFDKVGPWDEDFFLYSEETEFELRAADRGFRLAFVPEAHAVHKGGVSKVKPELWALTCANKVRLYAMRHRQTPAMLFWFVILAGELLRSAGSQRTTNRAAVSKLWRERKALVAGKPALHPYRQS